MHDKLKKHRQTLDKLSPIMVAAALLLCGLWLRWPNVGYDGPASPEQYGGFATLRGVYSDIPMLYFRDGLANHPRPYFDYPLEYPIGTGLVIYLLTLATYSMPQYFVLTSLAMSVCGLVTVALVQRFPRGNVWLFALSPALALYVNLNWDMWGVLLMVAALLLFVRERDGPATALLAAAVWTKFFPIVFLPFLILDRLRRNGRRAAGRIVAVFAIVSAINLPVLLLAPAAWWHFFRFNAVRPREWNLWTFFDPAWLTTDQINRFSAVLLLWGLVVLLLLQWRSPPRAEGICPVWLPACCAMLAWFFFVNKVYSPQYGLWIVVLLAILGAAPALAVAWSAADLLYFAAHFVHFGLWSNSEEARQWFDFHGYLPATALREVMLLVVVGWCVQRLRTNRPLASLVPQVQTKLWAIGALCTILLFVFLRAWRLGSPSGAIFDEAHYTVMASKYLSGEEFFDVHPPLGKLIIALGELAFGNTPVGWRVMPLLAGIGLIGAGYWVGKEIFSDRRVGLIMAFLLSVEGIFIVYSRTGLIDGFMLLFGLAALGFSWQFRKERLTGKRAWRYLVLAGLLAGLAVAVKWIGLGFLAIVAVITILTMLTDRERPIDLADLLVYSTTCVAIPAIVYTLPFVANWQTDFWGSFIEWHRQVWVIMTGFEATHPYGSAWWSWPLLIRPVWFYYENTSSGQIVGVAGLGNPVVWWGSTVVLVYTVEVILYTLIFRGRSGSQIIPREQLAPVVYLLAGWAVFYLPWILIDRVAFIYYYMASYLCALLLTSFWLGQALKTKSGQIITITALLVAFLIGCAFAPIWIAYPIPQEWLDRLMWFRSWI